MEKKCFEDIAENTNFTIGLGGNYTKISPKKCREVAFGGFGGVLIINAVDDEGNFYSFDLAQVVLMK